MHSGFDAGLVTIQPCHCEPFFGEAISRLSGQLDRLGISSLQRTLLARTCTNGFDAGLNGYIGVLFPWPCPC
jgi:hypothetical protein